MATIDRRTTKDGSVRWRARIRRRNIRESQSFASRAEAVRWANEVERAISRGAWSLVGRAGEIDFEQLVVRFLAGGRRSRDMRRQLDWWRCRIGSEPAATISRRRILWLRKELLREKSASGGCRKAATVNRYVSALSALFTWALRKGWIDHHPLRGISPLDEGDQRLRFLSDEERGCLLDACLETSGARLHALVTLALATGARRGELLGLRWSDIDLKARVVTFGRTGVQGGRSLPLPPAAVATLRPLAKVRRIGGNEVFANPSGSVDFPRRQWEAAVRVAELEDFRFHDLRHSAAAYLAQCGASLAEIAEFLGHKTLQGVQRYSGLIDRRSRSPVERLHERLFDPS